MSNENPSASPSKLSDTLHDILGPKKQGENHLHLAIRNGSKDLAEFVMSDPPSIDAVDENGNTALHLAVSSGDLELAKWTIDQGSTFTRANRDKKTAMDLAIESGNGEIIDVLKSFKCPTNQELKKRRLKFSIVLILSCCLFYGLHAVVTYQSKAFDRFIQSIREGNVGKVKDYLEAHPDKASHSDGQGNTPLLVAVQNGRADISFYLIDKGARINDPSKVADKRLPIHYAVRLESTEILEKLIKSGADLNVQDHGKHCPLHLSAMDGRVAATKLLLDAKVRTDLKTVIHETPLALAKRVKQEKIVELFKQYGIEK